jgi:hypothetical protein
MRIHVTFVLVVAACAAGCAQCGAPEPLSEVERPTAPAPGESPLDRPFVVFGARQVILDRLDSPVDVPVTPGSRASRATMESEDPSVVEIDAQARMVGLRAGRTFLRSRSNGDSRIEVVVRPATSLSIEPAQLVLVPGAKGTLTLVDPGTGAALDPAVATWSIAPADVASVWRDEVRAGVKGGRAVVTASYGGLVATSEVLVRAVPDRRILVNPAAARARVGQVLAFEAFDQGGRVAAPTWRSSDDRVLKALTGGLFAAAHAGKARVCAGTDGDGCATVEVMP